MQTPQRPHHSYPDPVPSARHGKGIQIHRRIATGKCAEINGPAIDAAAQQLLIDLGRQIEPGRRVGVHALAQRGARWNHTQTECAHEKSVAPKALYCIEVALAQTQQGQIGFDDVAVGRARANGKLRIKQGIDVGAPEVFADKSQSGVGAEVVGQLFDNKVGHVRVHLGGEWNMRTKLLISIGKSAYISTMKSRIQATGNTTPNGITAHPHLQ